MYKFIRSKQNINQIYAFGYLEVEKPNYDPNIFEEVELDSLPENYEIYKEKPFATGKSLVSKVEKAFSGQSFEFRMQLQSLFLPLKATLESETCNPLSVGDFKFVFKFLDTLTNQLTPEQTLIFKNLLTEFVNENQFFDYKPEEVAKIAKKLQA